jgi:hypothetical protein
MIPYSDLVTALRSWRERNGLPNFGVDPGPSAPAVIQAAPIAPAAPRTAPPAAPPRAPAPLVEVEDEIDASELESEDGGDFAMAFGVSPEPRAGELGAATATFDDDLAEDDAQPIKLDTDTDDATLLSDDDGTPPPR